MNRFTLTIALLSLSILSACSGGTETPVAYTPEWYRGSSVVTADGTVDPSLLDPNKIDLIYLVSTEVLSARDEEGLPLYQSTLTEEDRIFIDGEMAHVERHFSQGDFNYLAPYTISSPSKPPSSPTTFLPPTMIRSDWKSMVSSITISCTSTADADSLSSVSAKGPCSSPTY